MLFDVLNSSGRVLYNFDTFCDNGRLLCDNDRRSGIAGDYGRLQLPGIRVAILSRNNEYTQYNYNYEGLLNLFICGLFLSELSLRRYSTPFEICVEVILI